MSCRFQGRAGNQRFSPLFSASLPFFEVFFQPTYSWVPFGTTFVGKPNLYFGHWPKIPFSKLIGMDFCSFFLVLSQISYPSPLIIYLVFFALFPFRSDLVVTFTSAACPLALAPFRVHFRDLAFSPFSLRRDVRASHPLCLDRRHPLLPSSVVLVPSMRRAFCYRFDLMSPSHRDEACPLFFPPPRPPCSGF